MAPPWRLKCELTGWCDELPFIGPGDGRLTPRESRRHAAELQKFELQRFCCPLQVKLWICAQLKALKEEKHYRHHSI